ncbi:hypothetical protein ACRS3X_04170 [Ectopseudomonas hydrolytica]|uniref:hypothetical protein n=1 Tax=Ectopseudomonas hydrolytica TaxID=2493633 RepID=UPI0011D0ECCB
MPRRHAFRPCQGNLMEQVEHHTPKARMSCEWPYIAGSTCLVVLLIWQPLQPAALAVLPQHSLQAPSYAAQSLQDIDSSCYEVRSEAMSERGCSQGNCGRDKVSPLHHGEEFELSRSILTCANLSGTAIPRSETDKPQNMMIEVIRSNHSF